MALAALAGLGGLGYLFGGPDLGLRAGVVGAVAAVVAVPVTVISLVRARADPEVQLRRVTDMPEVWRNLPARQLLMIGGPGAGKSSTALLLARAILADDGELVPVLVNLADWDPSGRSLNEWFAERLRELYPRLRRSRTYGRRIAARLVAAEAVFPVLDGLDEMPAEARAEAIKALTDAAGRNRPLIVTCRIGEYEEAIAAAGTPLARAAVVELCPVEPEQAAEYLVAGQVNGERRWRQVVTRLKRHPNGRLAKALSTPLMVYLARTAYTAPDTNPAELLHFNSREEIEGRLLASYLPAVYHSPVHTSERADARFLPYQAKNAARWLKHLATTTRRSTLMSTMLMLAATNPLSRLTLALHLRSKPKAASKQRQELRQPRVVWIPFAAMLVTYGAALIVLLFATWPPNPSPDLERKANLVVWFWGLVILAASAPFSLTRIYLALTGRLPFRLMRFLEDAHQRGVLRQVGPEYQFRHARLQEYLASTPTPPPGPPPAPSR